MRRMQWTAILAMACMLLSACDDARPDQALPEYVIFGDYYGECFGNGCVDLYRIEGQKVYEDSKDKYPDNEIYSGQFSLRSDVSFEQVESLLSKIPAELYDETELVLGQPDAGDWGGYYLEVSRNNTRRFWLIDKHAFEGDDYLAELKAEMQAKLDLLEANSNQ